MTRSPRKKRKRQRKIPANIVTKTDREIMERVFGKRVLREVDATLETVNRTPNDISIPTR